MNIVVLILALLIGYVVRRLAWVFAGVVVVWAIALAMVAWGSAHSAGVDVGSAGFWVPWAIVLLIARALAYGLHALRSRLLRRAGRI